MDYRDYYPDIGSLVGKTITKIVGKAGDDQIAFTTSDGCKYVLFHQQDCCEHVYVESIVGDLQDLVDEPLLVAEEVSDAEMDLPHDEREYGGPESYTWTFYKFDTRKGGVTIRFFGSSNGYYGESACFARVA